MLVTYTGIIDDLCLTHIFENQCPSLFDGVVMKANGLLSPIFDSTTSGAGSGGGLWPPCPPKSHDFFIIIFSPIFVILSWPF